jgi:hypothetical protein
MDSLVSSRLMTRRQIKFVLVNGGTPISPSLCLMCCKPVGMGYLREIGTRLPYCDLGCYANHRKSTLLSRPPLERVTAHEATSQTSMV